jgi:hypothetical protein
MTECEKIMPRPALKLPEAVEPAEEEWHAAAYAGVSV